MTDKTDNSDLAEFFSGKKDIKRWIEYVEDLDRPDCEIAVGVRRLKHIELSPQHQERVLAAIKEKLLSGRFSVKIKDWLRLGLHISPEAMLELAHEGLASDLEYVRNNCKWLKERAEERMRAEG